MCRGRVSEPNPGTLTFSTEITELFLTERTETPKALFIKGSDHSDNRAFPIRVCNDFRDFVFRNKRYLFWQKEPNPWTRTMFQYFCEPNHRIRTIHSKDPIPTEAHVIVIKILKNLCQANFATQFKIIFILTFNPIAWLWMATSSIYT